MIDAIVMVLALFGAFTLGSLTTVIFAFKYNSQKAKVSNVKDQKDMDNAVALVSDRLGATVIS